MQARVPQMIEQLRDFVNLESPSLDTSQLQRSAEFLAELITKVTGKAPKIIPSDRGPHVHWKGSEETKVLILGHHDTVFPLGTTATRPFSIEGEIARGPGIFDMKAGIVQAIHGLSAIPDSYHVEMLITADEEVGSETSRELIEARARATGTVLVLEPSADGGALKIARKGVGTFTVHIGGRASHAGLEPEKGINALVELSEQVLRIVAMARPELGTTVTPTVATAGNAENVVPEAAMIKVDVRVVSPEEKERIELEMASLRAVVLGATIKVTGSINRPPMHESAGRKLFGVAEGVALELGIENLQGVAVGGGSDGNFTAAIGIPTLDGMGAVGGGAHGVSEHILVPTMGDRAALLAGVARALVNR
ncbi:MAG: M20/M25/M40 family metallo-hydrolase [Acidimicrobiaceae bacterium]|nr:M20/M25/M40 family metallo-hydrolase [Acidimicrobiaceae bacterium]